MKKLLAGLLAAALLALGGCGADSAAASAAASSSASSGVSSSAEVSGTWQVYCFQAGKADAILLYSGSAAVLIDTGESGFGKTIVSYLQKAGIDTLDALIITHFDQDHVGGAAKVLSSVTVKAVYTSDCPKSSKEYTKYLAALDSAGLTAVTVREDTSFTLDGAVFSISPPQKTTYQTDESNNSSLITSVSCGQTRFLFAGDAENDRIREFLAENPGSYDFLKVPYHGHWQTALQELIDEVQPEYAVITSSDKEPEDDETVAALEAAGAQVYLTREGGVLAVTDGKTVTVNQE